MNTKDKDRQTMLRIYNTKTDTLQEEYALISYHTETKKILAVGNEALSYLTTMDPQIQTVCPFQDGLITDFELALPIFQTLLQKNHQRTLLRPLKVAICIPKDTNAVHKRVFSDVLHQAGAKEITLSEDDITLTKTTLPSSYTLVIEIFTPKHSVSSQHHVPYQAYKFQHKEYEIDRITPINQGWTIILKHPLEQVQLTFPQTVNIQILPSTDMVPSTHILYQIQKEGEQDSHLYFSINCASYQIKITCDAMPVVQSNEIMP